MRFAYADPPYFGTARKRYGQKHSEAWVYDTLDGHRRLIERLCDEFSDGWALSLHEPSLHVILPLVPAGVRVAAWISAKPKMPPAIAVQRHWEPVIWCGGRKGLKRRCGDYHVSMSAPLRSASNRAKLPRGAPNGDIAAMIAAGRKHFGGKPRDFSFWIFSLLGARPGDEFHDLFPGSGAVSAAWSEFCGAQPDLPLTPLEAIAKGDEAA